MQGTDVATTKSAMLGRIKREEERAARVSQEIDSIAQGLATPTARNDWDRARDIEIDAKRAHDDFAEYFRTMRLGGLPPTHAMTLGNCEALLLSTLEKARALADETDRRGHEDIDR